MDCYEKKKFCVYFPFKYTEKVTFVKKDNVERHLSGEAHKIAVQAEGLTCTTSESNTSTRGQEKPILNYLKLPRTLLKGCYHLINFKF